MRIPTRLIPLVAAAATTALAPAPARAGGFDLPDVGTEALGRGGAFVAKADSPLAMYYNVAGMTQQRGTRLLIDVNLLWAYQSFTRAGVYPGDPADPRTPWAGQAYPTVENQRPFNYQPFVGLTTDLGFLKRWTFGLGVVAPPGVGNRQYGTLTERSLTTSKGEVKTVQRLESPIDRPPSFTDWTSGGGLTAPTPTRYDTGVTSSLMVMPTLAVAFQPIKQVSLGVAAHWVVAQAEITKATFNALGPSTCGADNAVTDCDAYSIIHTTASTYGFTLSALAHPLPWLDVGLTWRPHIAVESNGTGIPQVSQNGGAQVKPFPVLLTVHLPHIVRWGVRLVDHYADGSERADLELDGTWENWAGNPWTTLRSCGFELGKAVDANDPVYPCDPGNPNNLGRLAVNTPGQMNNTYSFRLGGAYNLRVSDYQKVTARVGGYYDSATQPQEWTNVGAYGATKYGLTAGLGFTHRGFTLNAAYATIFMPDRNVTNSQIRAGSATNGTDYAASEPVMIVGNGVYKGHVHTLSIGVMFRFSETEGRILAAN